MFTYAVLNMRKKYTNIGIPEELAKEIDILIKKLKLGFRSRAEFAVEAIRQKIENNQVKNKKISKK